MKRAGYVLAGGRSSRMGRDKATLPFRGAYLGQTVARTVERAAGSAVVVGNPTIHAALGYPVIPDLYPGEGPLGGIITALRHSRAEWNLVVACDMPEISTELLSTLINAAEDSNAAALIPVGPEGRAEPLCAVYRLIAAGPLEDAFAAGVRKILQAVETIPAARYPVTEMVHFQNVNTPEEWAGYAAQ